MGQSDRGTGKGTTSSLCLNLLGDCYRRSSDRTSTNHSLSGFSRDRTSTNHSLSGFSRDSEALLQNRSPTSGKYFSDVSAENPLEGDRVAKEAKPIAFTLTSPDQLPFFTPS